MTSLAPTTSPVPMPNPMAPAPAPAAPAPTINDPTMPQKTPLQQALASVQLPADQQRANAYAIPPNAPHAPNPAILQLLMSLGRNPAGGGQRSIGQLLQGR